MRHLPVTISSEWTPLFKFGFPALFSLLWAAVVGMLFLTPDAVEWNGAPGGTPPDAKWKMLGVGVPGLGYLVWACGGIVRVRLAGPELLLSNYFREIRVPAEQIEHVTRWWWARPGLVTVTFRERTPFGRRISFVPPGSLFGLFGLGWLDNSAVEELRRYAALHGRPGS